MTSFIRGRVAPLAALGLALTAGGCVTVDASPVFDQISGGATLAVGKGYDAGPLGFSPAFTNYRVFSPSECKGGTIASVSSFHESPEPRPIWAGKPVVLSADTGNVSSSIVGWAPGVTPSPIMSLQMSAPCSSAVMFTPRAGETYTVVQDSVADGCRMSVRDGGGRAVELSLLASNEMACDRPMSVPANGGDD